MPTAGGGVHHHSPGDRFRSDRLPQIQPVRELVKAERVNETYICRALRPTLLASAMVEAILDGRQPEGMTLPGLMANVAVEWRAAMMSQSCRRRVWSDPVRYREHDPANL